jgi:hypothetical protein
MCVRSPSLRRPLGFCLRVREAVAELARSLLRAVEDAAVLSAVARGYGQGLQKHSLAGGSAGPAAAGAAAGGGNAGGAGTAALLAE